MVKNKTCENTEASYLRKVRKPLVERQRRERMNNSIDQLKLLIADTIKLHMPPMTRVDKADILELTVFHLTNLQHQQRSMTVAMEAVAYNAGFKDCAREAVNYVYSNSEASGTEANCLSNHLHGTLAVNRPSNSASVRRSTPNQNRERLSVSAPLPTAANFSPITPYSVNRSCNDVSMVSMTSDSFFTDSDIAGSSVSAMSMTSSDNGSDFISPEKVSIGMGRENEIGHVIKDTVWRPF